MLSPLAARFVESQLSGDARGALRLVENDALAGGMTVPGVELGVILPAQQEIGRLWEANKISVAQEHLATSISQLVLSHLYPRLPREASNGKLAIVACVEGEHHDMGGRIGADFLEMAGFDVRFLGANVPTKDLLSMLDAEKPDLVGLSATMSFHVPALVKAVNGIHALRGNRFPVVVGGGVLKWAPALTTGSSLVISGSNAEDMVARCRKVLGC